jgi:hypothetical protein
MAWVAVDIERVYEIMAGSRLETGCGFENRR